MNAPTPYILIQEDIDPNGKFAPRKEECDCAPAFHIERELLEVSEDTPMICSNVYQGDLPEKHVFLVNSIENAGVVVANQSARKMWQLFETPRTPDSIRSDYGNGADYLALRMHQLGLLKVFGKSNPLFKKAPQILSAWLHVTNECNLRCTYCYVDKSHEFMSQSVGKASIDAVIRSAMNSKFDGIRLKYAGGEPTLNHKLILELDEYAKQQTTEAGLNYEGVVLSNGVALSESLINEFLSRGIRLMISLDGIEEAHNSQRIFVNGLGSFDWVKRSLEKLKRNGLVPFISVTITGNNVYGLPDTVDFLLEQALPFNINFFRDFGCAVKDLRLENEKLTYYLLQAFQRIEKRLPPYSLLNVILDRSDLAQLHNKTCGVGDSYLAINQHGQVAKCHVEIDKPITSVFDPDPLLKLKMDKTRFQNIPVDEKEGCRDCQWRYWCAGGCPLLTYNSTGRFDVKSPYCDVYQTIYPALLKLEGLRLMKYGGIPFAL